MKLPLNNSYTLLMIMLAPSKSPSIQAKLINAAENNKIQWEKLLYQANIQTCTPLWYARLKKDNFLSYLPADLVEYLAEIYQSNLLRNQQLQSALLDLLREFNAASIDTLLLKGAATFCDQLFSDAGSRFMGDLDILVADDKVESCRKILQRLGFKEIPDEGMELDGLPTDIRHHQLPRYFIPGTPVVVEIHFKLSYALAGRMITPDAAWKTRSKTQFMGQNTSVLSADHKLLLNAAHAMIPHCEYISGHISLLQLTEFVLLAQHYSESINWHNWFNVARQYSLSSEFKSYLNLAVHYMNLTLSSEDQVKQHSDFNNKRILFIGDHDAVLEQDKLSFYSIMYRYFYTLYYYLKLPAWMWQNVCYAPGWKNIPVRILFCLKKLFSSRSWKKI